MSKEMTNVERRQHMVQAQLIARGIVDGRVLRAFQSIPRELFVPQSLAKRAYDDAPLAIGQGQTISQPYVTALIAQALHIAGDERVLDIGTGSGYAAAILSRLARQVFTVERLAALIAAARGRLEALGCYNVTYGEGDGTLGWADHAPYDAIAVAAGAPRVPEALLQQLAPGGRLVIPIGSRESQTLVRVTRHGTDRFDEESLGEVRFVPLIGEQVWPRSGEAVTVRGVH